MFDTIMGLPLHPLVVHAVVILAPTAALFALAYAALTRSRRALWWPTLALTVVATGAALVAKESGERLANRVFTSLDSTAAGYAVPLRRLLRRRSRWRRAVTLPPRPRRLPRRLPLAAGSAWCCESSSSSQRSRCSRPRPLPVTRARRPSGPRSSTANGRPCWGGRPSPVLPSRYAAARLTTS